MAAEAAAAPAVKEMAVGPASVIDDEMEMEQPVAGAPKEKNPFRPIPPNEAVRIEALRALKILDTQHEEQFDSLVSLAKRVFGVPIALISFVDADRCEAPAPPPPAHAVASCPAGLAQRLGPPAPRPLMTPCRVPRPAVPCHAGAVPPPRETHARSASVHVAWATCNRGRMPKNRRPPLAVCPPTTAYLRRTPPPPPPPPPRAPPPPATLPASRRQWFKSNIGAIEHVPQTG